MAGEIKNIGAGITIDGFAEFKKAISEINQNMSVLGSEMRKVAAEFDNNAGSMAAATAKSDIYNRQMEEQRKKIDTIRAALATAAKEYGENSSQVKDWQTKLNNAEAQLKQTENALNRMNSELDESGDEFDEAGQSALSFSDILKANILSDAIMSGFRMLGDVIKSAVGSLTDFAKQGIETASNLQEVQNVVDVTFGASADVIDDFAKAAATSFGMSELSAKQFSGTMGAMLKSVGLANDSVLEMSTAITGLAGDMASFYNLDVETAFNKLRSGISGEIEPLKQLGINLSVANLEAFALSQGIKKAYSEMTEAEKVTLRYNYIMQATADAQGDFARTSDSYANQQRILALQMENLSAQIGKKLLPVVNELTTAFNELLSGEIEAAEFGERFGQTLSDLVNTITEELPRFVEIGAEIIKSLIAGISSKLPDIVNSILTVSNQIVKLFIDMLPDIVLVGADVILQLRIGIADALPELLPAITDTILTIVNGIVERLPALISAGIDVITALIQGMIEAIPAIIDAIPEIIAGIIVALIYNTPKIIQAGIDLFVSLVSDLPAIIEGIVTAVPQIVDAIEEEFENQWPTMEECGKQLMWSIIEGMFTFVPFLLDFFKWLSGEGDLPEHSGGTGKTFGGGLSRGGSGKTFGSGTTATGSTFGDVPVHDEESTAKTVDALSKISTSTERFSTDLSTVIKQVGVDTEDTIQSVTEKMIAEIQENNRKTQIIAEATAATERLLNRSAYDPKIGRALKPGEGYIDWGNGNITWIGKNAAGTDFWRGGLTWVGEQGPELVNLPRGSQVLPADQSRKIGGDTTINIIADISKIKSVEDIIRLAEMAKMSQRMGYVGG